MAQLCPMHVSWRELGERKPAHMHADKVAVIGWVVLIFKPQRDCVYGKCLARQLKLAEETSALKNRLYTNYTMLSGAGIITPKNDYYVE